LVEILQVYLELRKITHTIDGTNLLRQTTHGTMMADTMVALFDLCTPFALQVGIYCAAQQIGLYLLFATNNFGAGPWSYMPSFTAHQIVVLPVLIYLSIQGFREFNLLDFISTSTTATSTAVERVTSPMHGYFSEFVVGMMFFWDIPTGLCTPALRELPMILHHIGMFSTAAISMGALSNGTPIFGYYAPFYFGVIEISSVPLIIVDLFHPKHKAWNTYLKSNERSRWIVMMNDVSRPLFAFLFVLVRMIAFPYISVMGVLRDVMYVTSLPLEERNNVPSLPMYIIAFLNVFFSCLQLYWGTLIIRQVIKVLQGPSIKAKGD
jgi:TLC domain